MGLITEDDLQRLGQAVTGIYRRTNRINKLTTWLIIAALLSICLQMSMMALLIVHQIKTPNIKAEIEDYFEDTTELAQVENFEIYED